MKNKQLNETQYRISYISPLRLVVKDNENISFTLEEINNCTYDHSILCRIVGEVKSVYKGTTINCFVCGDGAVAIEDTNKSYSANDLIMIFNDIFCKLLIAGVETESIDNRDLNIGWKHGNNSIWPVNFGNSLSSTMHGRIRMRLANNIETIFLDNASKNAITIADLTKLFTLGQNIIEPVKNLSTYYLITGFTELKYGNWSSALSSLWIIIEQLIDYLWEYKFLSDKMKNPEIPSRLQTLKQDHRTYSASVKQEILYQTGILPLEVYQDLYCIRKFRNKLVHEGVMVDKLTAISLYNVIRELLVIATNCENIPLFKSNLAITDRLDLIDE